jgi:hypothetical protein
MRTVWGGVSGSETGDGEGGKYPTLDGEVVFAKEAEHGCDGEDGAERAGCEESAGGGEFWERVHGDLR